VAGFVRVLATGVARTHLQHPQRFVLSLGQCRLHVLQRMQCQPMARAFGGQEKQLVQPVASARSAGCAMPRHGLEHGKDGAQRLANAGGAWAIRQRPPPPLRRAVDRHRQLPLPGAKRRHGKGRCRQRRIALLAVPCFAARPVQIAAALHGKKLLQLVGTAVLHQHGFLLSCRSANTPAPR
jgi:hypothetical protein